MRAVRVHENGGPEVIRVEDIDVPDPGPGQARVRIDVAGLNFIDTYHRKGTYDLDLPMTLGREGAGTVDAVGDGVDEVAEGDRVVFAMSPSAQAEFVVVDAWKLAPVPDGVDLEVSCAAALQGMTAHYLCHSTFELREDHTALVLAAAGGVGHLLTQLCARIGARVIATAGTEDKADLARELGADEVILYEEADLAERVHGLTDGRGVDVVYDGVGRSTFEASIDSLRPRGMMVLYGAASGPVPPIDPQLLNRKGSLFLTRPSLQHHLQDRDELLWRAGDLHRSIGAGELEVLVDRTFSFEEAADAHRYIEGRNTRGKVLLTP